MAIEKEKFFEIIKNVSESKDLSGDNLLQKIKDELYEVEKKLPEEDCGEYNKFKNGLWKDHLFSVKTSNGPVDYTLLHLAIESNNVLMVKLLINKTVRVDMRIKDGSSNGLTALHIAASHGYEEIVQLLLDANANPSLKDSQGRTPKDVVGTIDNIQNKEIIVKRLETAEKSYLTNSKQKVRDLKPQDESIHHLSQVNHKTQASTAVDGNNASTTLGNDKRKPEIKVQVWGENKKENNSSVQSEQTSSNSITDESSGNTVNEQRRSVKDRVKEIESLQKINTTCSSKQAPAIESDSDDSGLELGPETIPSSSNSKLEEIKNQHSKHVTENETRLKTFDKLYEDKSLKQKMQNLESENATLKGKLEENKDQHSKYVAEHEARLEALNKQNQEKSKLQEQEIKNLKSENTKLNGELEEIKNQHSKYVAEHEAKLEAFNKRNEENKLLKQEINNLKSENAKLNSELEKNKNQHSQTSEVSLKKVEKKPPLSKVAYVSLVATSVVGSIFSIVSGLSVLSMIATSVTSALVAGGITYKMSKPTTELKEVNIQSPGNNKACEI